MMQPSEYAARRQRVIDAVGEDGALVIAATPERIRNNDVEYPYRAASDVRYLTGFTEPEAVVCLLPGRAEGEFVLFCRDRDPDHEVWTGRRAGPDGAVRDFAADQAWPVAELEAQLPELLAGRSTLHCPFGRDDEQAARIADIAEQTRQRHPKAAGKPDTQVAAQGLLHAMRLRKSAAEIETMRSAAQVSARAHVRAMQACQPGLFEYQLAADIHHEFERAGMHWAYPTIVGGGDNGCILHYIENSAALRDGDLVLIDAGAEYAGYAADITRTFPVNGRFSGPQRALYDLVLEAQHAAIDAVQVGKPYTEFHETAVRVLVEGMIDLGLLQGERDGLIEQGAHRRFYMHGTGHWLGMDVHDVGAYRVAGQPRALEENMTLTVEPGLYVPDAAEGVDARFHGIGIRIEDDVRVAADGPDVLTAAVPKAADDIEALMRQP